jgi:hypothetical protein
MKRVSVTKNAEANGELLFKITQIYMGIHILLLTEWPVER